MNLGGTDRVLRLFGGLGIVTVDYFADSYIEIFLLAIGAWGVITSFMGICPFYSLMGVNTCPTK